MNTSKLICIVSDIDGRCVHTIEQGSVEEVLGRADERLAAQIRRAVVSGDDTETFERDGEVYTTRVVVKTP